MQCAYIGYITDSLTFFPGSFLSMYNVVCHDKFWANYA